MSQQIRRIQGAAPLPGAALRASSDELVAQRARAGEGEALVELALRHWKRVYRVARNMLVPDAARAAEETFRRAIFSARTFSDGVAFRGSLYRAAIEVSLARLHSSPVERSPRTSDERSPRTSDSLAERIREALGRLDAMDRACYVLRDVEDLSAEEAAFVLRTSRAIVRQRAHRARLMVIGWAGERGSSHAGSVLHGARIGARGPEGR